MIDFAQPLRWYEYSCGSIQGSMVWFQKRLFERATQSGAFGVKKDGTVYVTSSEGRKCGR